MLKQYGEDPGARQLQPDGLHGGAIATKAMLGIKGDIHGRQRQPGVQGREGLQDRHPLQAVVLRRRAAAHPQQHRPHDDTEGRQSWCRRRTASRSPTVDPADRRCAGSRRERAADQGKRTPPGVETDSPSRAPCPSWQDFQPFIVTGLALGGVYALSGRRDGRALPGDRRAQPRLRRGRGDGRVDRLAADQRHGVPRRASPTSSACCSAALVTLLYGVLFGPPLAARDPLVKAVATLGLALILLGAMSWIWSDKARSMVLPTTTPVQLPRRPRAWRSTGRRSSPSLFGVVVTIGTRPFLRYTKLGTAMRALADDREITATLGVPVRRVEAAAWLGSGLIVGRRRAAALQPRRARRGDADVPGHLVARRGADRAAAVARGDAGRGPRRRASSTALVTPISCTRLSSPQYRDMAPFVLAIVALLVPVAPPRRERSRGRRVVEASPRLRGPSLARRAIRASERACGPR